MSKDLDKSRIEVLRDATKDVSDTLRALDRKTSYIMSILLFIFSGYVIIMTKINSISVWNNYNELGIFFPLIYLIISLFFYFFSYSPVSNPQNVLQKQDQTFGFNKFYSPYIGDGRNNAKTCGDKFINDTKDIESLARILYVEIFKLSKIRERRIDYIKLGNKQFLIGSIIMLLQIITLSKFNFELFLLLVIYEIYRFIKYIFCFGK